MKLEKFCRSDDDHRRRINERILLRPPNNQQNYSNPVFNIEGETTSEQSNANIDIEQKTNFPTIAVKRWNRGKKQRLGPRTWHTSRKSTSHLVLPIPQRGFRLQH